jgi:hypothetical protein
VKNIKIEDRALRGGSWCDVSGYCRASFRYEDEPGYRFITFGFRVALSSPQDRSSLPSSVLPSNSLSPGSP